MKFENFRHLVVDDFSKDEQDLISKLGGILNPFMDQITQFANKNVSFNDNVNASIKTFKVVVSSGIPITSTKLQTNLVNNCKGIFIIKVRNLTDSTFLTGAPFITFSESNKILTINHITGLSDSKQYEITCILIGNDI